MRRRFHVALGVSLAALFLWLTLRHIEPRAMVDAARGLAWPWLLAAPVFLSLGYACRISRWQAMLRQHNPTVGRDRCAVALLSSVALNNLLPLRAGDVLRCVSFSGWLGVRAGPVVATVLVERLLDLLMLILALALALWLLAPQFGTLGLPVGTVPTLASAALVSLGLLLFPRVLGPLLGGVGWLADRLGLGAVGRVKDFLATLLAALEGFSRRGVMPGFMGWSVAVWAFEGASYWAIAQAFTTLLRPDAAWLAMPLGTLSTLLPSTPGHVGTFDYFAQAAMLALDNPLAAATAFVLLTHAMLWLTTTLVGTVCLLIWRYRVIVDLERQRRLIT